MIKSKRKRIKRIFIASIVVLMTMFVSLIVYWKLPYSPLKDEYDKFHDKLLLEANVDETVFMMQDIDHLPYPVQRFFMKSGFIGRMKMRSMDIYYEDVTFIFDKKTSAMQVDYYEYCSAEVPNRVAYIDTSMYGIPYQGYDEFVDGEGSLRAVYGKMITTFKDDGEGFIQESMLNYLAMSVLMPSAALQDALVWEEIDESHAKATLSYKGVQVSGIYTFNTDGELISFEGEKPFPQTLNGEDTDVIWKTYYKDYKQLDDVKLPSSIQTIWNYQNADVVYFDGDITSFRYH